MQNEIELHSGLKPYLNCKDYLVSDESYEIMKNERYDMLVTSPVPADLSEYYENEKYISHTDSKKTIFDKVYQFVKKISIRRKYKLIKKFNTHKKILDIGAGTGDFLSFFRSKGWNVYGVEPNSKARDLAQKKGIELKEKMTTYYYKEFDVITMWHVLEHIPDIKTYINRLKGILSDTGVLFIAVPNFKSYDAKYYKEYWAAYDVPRHLWHFSQQAIERLFSEIDMTVIEKHPLRFDAYYASLLSEKYKTGKKNILKALYIGWRSNKKAQRTTEYSSIIYILKKK